MNRSKCPECGFVGWANAESCKRCGAAISPSMAPPPVPAPATAFAYPNAAAPMPNVPVPYPAPNVYPPAKLKTGLAIAALTTGIVNFTCLGMFIIPIVVGIVISVVALNKINQRPHEYGGKGLAVAGLVTNIVSVVVMVPIMLAIAIPNFFAARMAANEGSAQQNLRRISEAEQTYYATVGNRSYGSLTDLQGQSLIPLELAVGIKSGYRFKVEVSKNGFAATATPTEYRSSGLRSFFIDETGILRGEDTHGREGSRYATPLDADFRSFGRRTSRDPENPY